MLRTLERAGVKDVPALEMDLATLERRDDALRVLDAAAAPRVETDDRGHVRRAADFDLAAWRHDDVGRERDWLHARNLNRAYADNRPLFDQTNNDWANVGLDLVSTLQGPQRAAEAAQEHSEAGSDPRRRPCL